MGTENVQATPYHSPSPPTPDTSIRTLIFP